MNGITGFGIYNCTVFEYCNNVLHTLINKFRVQNSDISEFQWESLDTRISVN